MTSHTDRLLHCAALTWPCVDFRFSGLWNYRKFGVLSIKTRAFLRSLHCLSLKMYAAVIVGLVVLLIPSGHCRPQKTSSALQGVLEAVQLLTTSSIDKRQTIPAYATCITNGLRDVIANSPQDCASAFSLVTNPSTIFSGGALNLDAITTAYRVFCQPSCGDLLIAFYNRCNAPRDAIDAFRGACARNSAGRLCYELTANLVTDLTQILTDCNSQSSTNCTSNCRNALTTFGSNSGCCINIANNTALTSISSFTAYQYSVWSGCGVDTPGFCDLETSSLSSAGVPKFVKTLFLLTLIVMAMLLL